MGSLDIKTVLYTLPAILIGLTLHELAHAYTALKLGDDTAQREGRITLNPLKHIDPVGMLFIIFAGFGWAKPVMFNPEKLKNPRRDEMLIAASGPLTNLILGITGALFFKGAALLSYAQGAQLPDAVITVAVYFIVINIGLFVFNSLPFPPLDGSHILFKSLKVSPRIEQRITRYGSLLLFGVIIADSQLDSVNLLPIGYVVEFILGFLF